MQEIKLKFWDKQLNKMVYMSDTELALKANGEIVELYKETKIWNDSYTKHYIPILYTGLKDKNGKEIYEGDIVRDKYSTHILHSLQEYIRKRHNWLEDNRYEIIGNIYENPELVNNEITI